MRTPLPVAQGDSDNYPPLSALNDLLFCARRCYLHRVEALWLENVHTVSGTLAHQRVHAPRDADESPFRTARGLRLVSHRLRLFGVADLVEFHPEPGGGPDVPFPVEYKRGRRRRWDNDEVQVCAQALCLEEMLGVLVPAGAVFSVRSKRRREVCCEEPLRRRTEEAAARLHQLLASGLTPPPVVHPKCHECSVKSVCLPELVGAQARFERAARNLFTPIATKGMV
jgi:CRISPR-associated exonuclease Cas4